MIQIKNNQEKKIIAIIQARMGSMRFPQKMSKLIGPYPLIDWVIKRSLKSNFVDELFLATTKHKRDDFLVDRAKNHSIQFYRGHENDVLSRFIEISKISSPKIIIRICADNPFVDSFELDRLINFYLKNSCDYSFNHQNRMNSGYADGFGAEIFSYDTLRKLSFISKNNNEREHMTLGIWNNRSLFKIKPVPCPHELSFPNLRFDIDTEDDFKKIKYIIDKGVSINSSAFEIINTYHKECL